MIFTQNLMYYFTLILHKDLLSHEDSLQEVGRYSTFIVIYYDIFCLILQWYLMIEHVCFYQKPVDSTSYCLYYNTSDNALVAHYKWRPQPRDPGHNCLSYSNGVYGIDLHMAIHRWNKCIWKLQIQETKINPWIYLLQLSHVTTISSANCLWLPL